MIPDVILVTLLVVVTSLAATFLWSIVVRVPAVPTPMSVVREMVAIGNLQPGDRVVDLGAGDGRLLIEAKRSCPGIHARGCEIVPTVWLIGQIRKFF